MLGLNAVSRAGLVALPPSTIATMRCAWVVHRTVHRNSRPFQRKQVLARRRSRRARSPRSAPCGSGRGRRGGSAPCAGGRCARRRCGSRHRRRGPRPGRAAARALKTRPGRCISASSRRNSVGPRWTSRLPRRTRQSWRSSTMSAKRRHVAGQRRRGAAQHRAHAGDELGHRERLGHVVVGADVEPAHPVLLLAAGGQHDDRDVAGPVAGADLAAELDARDVRQHPVEQHQVGLRPRRRRSAPRRRRAEVATVKPSFWRL